MFTIFIRFVAALAVIVSIVENTAVARADHGTPPSVSSQNPRPPRVPDPQPLDIPALNIPPASSLGVQFVHVATAANINAHTTLIDHPLTNGNPNAIIIVTENRTPGGVGGATDLGHIGVFYNGGQWGIYHENLAAMPLGTAFNVIIPTAGTGVFVQTANASANSTIIDNPLTNDNPNAIVFVTPNFNPGNVGGTNANFPISVLYNNILNKWVIFDQNGGAMSVNTAFNVFVLTAGTGVFVHQAIAGNTSANSTTIDNPLTNGHPNAIVFVTPNFNPGGVGGTLNEHHIALFYNGSKWEIYNQDAVAIPVNAAFNVLVLVPSSDIFVSTGATIDNALTNGHSNAIVFTTLNFNPGGVGGTINNHNIGVFYNGSKSIIFNQDNGAMLPNAAFNVLVPNPDTSVFVHTATAANTSASDTTIDYPLTNGNPNAIILVTPNYNPGGVGGTLDNHPIGVYYIGGKWRIRNQDFLAMPVGAAFNVSVPTTGAGVGVFVHSATAGNSGANLTFIDNPLTNGNPNAIILVTPNYDPGNICGCVPANFPIGVGYDSTTNRWVIFSQNGAPDTMPVGAAFNVYAFGNYKQLYLPLVLR